MSSFRLTFSRQAVGYFIAAAAILLAAFIPALAMAAQVTERSVALSTSSADASAATYTVNFTAPTTAAAFVLDFCTDSPVIGEDCAAPAGFKVDTATSTTSGFVASATTSGADNQVVITGTVTGAISVELTGIDNPTAAGNMYARIVTFDTNAHALAYVSNPVPTGVRDTGSVVIPITSTIGVSGAVLESMSFCVAGAVIDDGCDLTGNTAPNLVLGDEITPGVYALSTSTVNEGDIFAQITTNAATGAVVNLKSSAAGCGGLINSSRPSECYITPALKTNFTSGAKFGLKFDTVGTGTGTLAAATGSDYNASTFVLNYASNELTGVTSTYGDPFVTTSNLPANNLGIKLTFGAGAATGTPAGAYSADLSLIATGKF